MEVTTRESVDEPTNEIRWGNHAHWVPRGGGYVRVPTLLQKWTITQYVDGLFDSVQEVWRPIPDELYVNMVFEDLYDRIEFLAERIKKLEGRGDGT